MLRRGDASLAWPGEARRREERRVEARLAKGLQRLDEVKLYHLNTLTREQRRLHRDLLNLNLRAGNLWRFSSGLGSRPLNPDTVSHNRTQLPTIPLSGKESERLRPVKPASGSSSLLQARVQEFISSGDVTRGDGSTAPLCLPDLRMQPGATNTPTSTTGNSTTMTTTTTTPGESDEGKAERERGRDSAHKEKERERGIRETKTEEDNRDVEEGMIKQTHTSTHRPTSAAAADTPLVPFEVFAPDGRLRTVHTLPNFAAALAEARKARYIRHRGRPPCETELTIPQIFARSPRPSHTFF